MSNTLNFDHIFVLFNPASTRAEQSVKRIGELVKLYPGKVEVVTTSPDGNAANLVILQNLAERLNEKTLLCIAAGDGTTGLVIETLVATGKGSLPKKAQQAPIMPLWGGNANDLAYMLNGLPTGKRLKQVFAKASVIPIYPLQCTIESGRKTTSHIAACYIAFGVSGAMANTLNESTRDDNQATIKAKWYSELTELRQAVRQAKRFSYTQGSRKLHAYELLFANGSRMAKVDRLPVALSDPYFYAAKLEHTELGAVARKLFKIASSKSHEKHTRKQMHKQSQFVLHNKVWAQFDGEPEIIPADSKITIKLHSRPFFAVASSIRPPSSARKPNRLQLWTSQLKRAAFRKLHI